MTFDQYYRQYSIHYFITKCNGGKATSTLLQVLFFLFTIVKSVPWQILKKVTCSQNYNHLSLNFLPCSFLVPTEDSLANILMWKTDKMFVVFSVSHSFHHCFPKRSVSCLPFHSIHLYRVHSIWISHREHNWIPLFLGFCGIYYYTLRMICPWTSPCFRRCFGTWHQTEDFRKYHWSRMM